MHQLQQKTEYLWLSFSLSLPLSFTMALIFLAGLCLFVWNVISYSHSLQEMEVHFFFFFFFLDNSFLIDVYLVSVFVFQGVWLSVCLPAFLPIYLSDYRPTHALKMIFKKSWVLFLSPDESFCISLIDLEIEGERQQWIWDPLLIGNAFALGGVVRNSLMGLKFRALIQFYQYILLYVGT